MTCGVLFRTHCLRGGGGVGGGWWGGGSVNFWNYGFSALFLPVNPKNVHLILQTRPVQHFQRDWNKEKKTVCLTTTYKMHTSMLKIKWSKICNGSNGKITIRKKIYVSLFLEPAFRLWHYFCLLFCKEWLKAQKNDKYRGPNELL